MDNENLRSLFRAARRHLEQEIARLENEIAQLHVPQSFGTSMNFVNSCTGISRILPEDDVESCDSFRTAETSRSFSRGFEASVTHTHNPTHSHTSPVPTSNSRSSQIHSPGHPLKVPFPPFLHDNVEMWFWATEKWFEGTNTYDDDHRFAAILLALPIATASVFREQFDSPPQSHKYAFAKQLIIKHFSKNQFERIRALVDRIELGDTKPSELYAQMKQIAGDAMSHSTLKGLWIMRLPEQWRPSLTLSSDDPLVFLHAADLMHQVSPRNNLCAINPTPNEAASAPQASPAAQQVCAVAGQKSFFANNSFQKFSTRTADGSQPKAPSLCFYHRKYGVRARRCTRPCSWTPKDQSNTD